MDEETINGYKNEICILISLQDTCDCGIIQMIDSQVDLERKLILVVIEFSQEDLKCCALQERPHSPWTTNLRSYWKQMVTAVGSSCHRKQHYSSRF